GEAHSVRLSEKMTGMSDSGTSSRTMVLRPIRYPSVQAARTKGTNSAKLPPQSLVNTNGADGRGTGNPRNDCTWAVFGWTRLKTKEFDWKCLGITLAANVVTWRCGRARPRKPPPTTTSQKATMALMTALSD